MSKAISTAATGLPSRRAALASLAGLGAALALPKVVHAASLAPDADLIRLAASVEGMACKLNDLWCTRSDLEDRADALKPAAPAEIAAHQHHEAAVQAWEAECERIERSVGVRAAGRRCDRLDKRLKAAGLALADRRPATLPGVVAKARAAAAANPDDAFSDLWLARLSASVIRDVIAIGGDA